MYIKTLRIPVHYATTKRKRNILNRLTARLSYAVRLWCKLIEENNIKTRSQLENINLQHRVQEKTRLSAGFVQQAGNKALWMWTSYREQHAIWKRMLSKTKLGSKWYNKLLKREPKPPCTSKHSLLKKQPVRFDPRTGKIEKANLKLTSYVAHISTLVKGETINVPLNPCEYHRQLLEKGTVRDFELVWDDSRGWMVHAAVAFQSMLQPVAEFMGVDLGVCRAASTVLIVPSKKPHGHKIFRSGKLKLQRLNDHISHLQRLGKYKALNRLRNKRRNVSEYYDWLLANELAESCKNVLVVFGSPGYIRYNNYRGNNKQYLRKLLQSWSFRRQTRYAQAKLNERGIQSLVLNEWGTSNRCHRCHGKVERPYKGSWRRMKCLSVKCGLEYDSDFGGAANTAQRGISVLRVKSPADLVLNGAGAPVERARTRDDSAEKVDEPRSPTF